MRNKNVNISKESVQGSPPGSRLHKAKITLAKEPLQEIELEMGFILVQRKLGRKFGAKYLSCPIYLELFHVK